MNRLADTLLDRRVLEDAAESSYLRAADGTWKVYAYAENALVPKMSSEARGFTLLRGLAIRYENLADGRQPIVGVIVPGDLAEFESAPSCHIQTLVRTEIAVFGASADSQALAQLRRLQLQILQQWLINIGNRNALQRTAHFFCEMFTRLQAAGLADGLQCSIPFTQSVLSRALAMTSIHLNRTLKTLRDDGLIEFHDRILTINDLPRLKEVAGFDDAYLRVTAFPAA